MTKRVLADIRRDQAGTELWFAGRRLNLDQLAHDRRASLASLPTTIVIEADVRDLTVLALGDTRPHPRTAALRAVADNRFDHAREYFEQLGEATDADVELLCARITLKRKTGGPNVEADFHKLLTLPALTLQQAQVTYEGLGDLQTACAPAFVGWAERLSAHPPRSLNRLIHAVPQAHWGTRLPFLAITQVLADTPLDESDIVRAETILAGARPLASGSDVEDASRQIAKAREQLVKRAERQAKALLASRPDFAEIEKLFEQPLPAALRKAWSAHYEGRTVGFGFIEVKKDKLDKLTTLGKKLERALDGDERKGTAPCQLLPFAIGEHEGDYFALDLARPTGGDFAVRAVFNTGTGGNVLAYETSEAWLQADGAPKY